MKVTDVGHRNEMKVDNFRKQSLGFTGSKKLELQAVRSVKNLDD